MSAVMSEYRINHLKQTHRELDNQIINLMKKNGNEQLVKDLKKRKLHLKDRIEYLIRQQNKE